MAHLFDDEAEGSDDAMTSDTELVESEGEGESPPKRPSKRVIKCNKLFCTGPWTPDTFERLAKLKTLLIEHGVKTELLWWAVCEERGKPSEQEPEGYHHGHVAMIFKNQTTLGTRNTPKIQRALSEDANWCINIMLGTYEVRTDCAPLKELYARNNIHIYS